MTALETIAGPSVFLRGRISNALDQTGVQDADIVLEYRQGGDWTALPFAESRRSGGWYSVATSQQMLSARIALATATEFRITASHPKYQSDAASVSLSAGDMTLATSVITVGGQATEQRRLVAAPITLDLALTPRPVMLGGMVISENQPDVPVDGATVTITDAGGSSTTSDAEGRFRFDVLPMARTLTVQATKGALSTNVPHTVDFDLPVNQLLISLD